MSKQSTLFAELLREYLDTKQITQKEFAEILNVSEVTIIRWLKGGNEPTGTAASVIALLMLINRGNFSAYSFELNGLASKGYILLSYLNEEMDSTAEEVLRSVSAKQCLLKEQREEQQKCASLERELKESRKKLRQIRAKLK